MTSSSQAALDSAENHVRPRLVVGIGASAGGLSACKRFFSQTPDDTGMAFVVVMHLDPSHESHMAEILRTVTTMQVSQVADQEHLQPDHVYVIAPDSSLEIRGGVLNSKKPNDPQGRRKPIDAFFSSLGEDQAERAVAIVLSGTGNNGSAGIQDVRAAGGLCIAQDPATAEYDGMPRNTIGTGVADHILAPEMMPAVVIAYGERAYARGLGLPEEQSIQTFDAILDLVGRTNGLDFRLYKKGTLKRRTERRSGITQSAGLHPYLQLLGDKPEEVAALYRDLLIGVTRFFRDRDAWDYIEQEIAPHVVAAHSEEAPLRIWAPACATGEEAYSLAILFLEQIERSGRKLRLHVYASDVNDDAVATARRGLYPSTIEGDVSHDRLRRFFERDGDYFHVSQEVRNVVTFAAHNLLSDPPFSKMDIVSCRNLLIYLEPEAQDQVLQLFHFALRPGGILFLGSSETIGRANDLFHALSKTHRTYRSNVVTRAGRYPLSSWISQRTPARGLSPLALSPSKGPRGARIIEQLVLSRYTTACVAVNQSFEMLYSFGPTDKYLVQPTGEMRTDLLSWARSGLYPKLRSGLHRAVEHRERVNLADILIERDDSTQRVECTIEPILLTDSTEGLLLVAFWDAPTTTSAASAAMAAPIEEPLVRQLEAEVKDLRQELQSTVEQLDSTNEEYRASHEELLSLNEELQSGNEELESSKEELQSMNEEMVTLNRQLEDKNVELRGANADLNHLFVSTQVPTIFLDRESRIRRYTPAATEVMRLVASDVGRSIEHVKQRLRDDRLPADIDKVLETLTPVSTELETEEGRWYLRRVVPYRTPDDRIDGVSVTFVDITSHRIASQAIDDARIFAEAMVQTIRTPLLVLNAELRVLTANDSFLTTFRTNRDETENQLLYELGNHQWDIASLRTLLGEILPQSREIKDYVVEHTFESLDWRRMILNARKMERSNGSPLILLAIEDVTERGKAEMLALQRTQELAEEHRRKDEFLAMLGHELRNPLSGISYGIDLLGKVAGDPARVEKLRQMMHRQTDRMTTLLGQLLDIARVVSGKVEIAKNPIDLVSVLRLAIETVAPLVQARRLDLISSLSESTHVFVLGDSIRLTQVFDNLLTNAIKYTNEEGRIAVTVEPSRDTVRVRISDTGIGMTADFLPHIFELFTQAPRALARSEGGMGLGLPLVQRLVAAHGGQVEASSAGSGQGSEFLVTLPRLPESDVHRVAKIASVPPAGISIPARRVLIVDDEEDAATTLAALLETEGHQALAVHTGSAALEAMHSYAPEVVLIDLGMPGLDGYEVARRIRTEIGDKNVLLVALSGYRRDPARLIQAGFDQYLSKPPTSETIASVLAGFTRG